MIDIATVPCPNCTTPLVIEGLVDRQRVQCSRCRAQFHLQAQGGTSATIAGTMPQTNSGTQSLTAATAVRPFPESGVSNAARTLGILSVFPLFGLAAIIVGLAGLRDIRRHPTKRGTGRAVFGIIAGVASTLCWIFVAIIVVGIVLSSRSFQRTGVPAKVAAVQIAPLTPPRDMKPVFGEEMRRLGRRAVVYGAWVRDPQTPPATLGSVLVVEQFPPQWSGQTQVMESWLRQRIQSYPRTNLQIEETRTLTYTVRGHEVQVTQHTGRHPTSGERRREYIGFIVDGAAPIGVLINTADEPPDPEETSGPQRHSLSEDEVRSFFESFGQPPAEVQKTGVTGDR